MYYTRHIVIEKRFIKGVGMPLCTVSVKQRIPVTRYWGSMDIPEELAKKCSGINRGEIPPITKYSFHPTFDHFIHLSLEIGQKKRGEKPQGFIIFFESQFPTFRTTGSKIFDLPHPTERKSVIVLEEGQYIECCNMRFEVNDGLFLARPV